MDMVLWSDIDKETKRGKRIMKKTVIISIISIAIIILSLVKCNIAYGQEAQSLSTDYIQLRNNASGNIPNAISSSKSNIWVNSNNGIIYRRDNNGVDTAIIVDLSNYIQSNTSPTLSGLTITGINGVLKASSGVISGSATVSDIGAASSSTTITGNNGLTGGGDLSTNRTIGLNTLSSTESAYWIFPQGVPTTQTTSISMSTNNTIVAARVYLPIRISFTKIGFNVATAGGVGSVASCAIYTSDGSSKLADTTPLNTNASTGAKVTTISAVTLNPGFYICACAEDHLLVTVTIFSGASYNSALNNFINNGTVQIGTAGSAASGAILPSSLGSITDTAATFNMPAIKISN